MILTVVASLMLSLIPETKDTLSCSVITSSIKRTMDEETIASPVTTLRLNYIEEASIYAPKSLSGIVPGLTIPDYGSAMTSTIYIRGIGSRMENPVISLYVDDIPILDKNAYDFSFMDIRRLDMLRGPQGTLYGRNSMLGTLSIETISPAVYQGGRFSFEAGSAMTFKAKASVYKGNTGAAIMYRHSNGFYTNEYSGKNCDKSDGLSMRLRYAKNKHSHYIDNTFTVSALNQGGYPYRLLNEDGNHGEQALMPISYNDKSGYKRISIMDGLRVKFSNRILDLSSATSIQMLFDSMQLDQDFTTKSMFTLKQIQRQYAITQEFIGKPKKHCKWWDSQTGIFAFVKRNSMGAPVRFLPDGINSLILDNANAHIPQEFGKLSIQEDNFLINSDFTIFTYNAAAYHESYLKFGKWTMTAGLRLDHEGTFMNYGSNSSIHFIISPAMPDYESFNTDYSGKESNLYFQLLPKISTTWDAASSGMKANGTTLRLTASIAKGYKAGGFNTQIFSDILQNKMMNGLMEYMGVHLDGQQSATARNTTYKPETCIDYEVSGQFGFRRGGHRLNGTLSLYYIDCRNQQLTVFPYGNGTGRMMTNAGKSRSYGAESDITWKWRNLSAMASGSVMDARFSEYSDGRADYSGKRLPYSPCATLYCRSRYVLKTGLRTFNSIIFAADINTTGSIAWNEDNSLVQKPYTLIGADISMTFGKFKFQIRGENLTDTAYNTFYFKSIGNSFFQTGKPRRFTLGLSLEI